VKIAAASVDVFVKKGAAQREKRAKSLFDYAFRYPSLGVGKKFQKFEWRNLEKDPANPQYYWLVTRVAPKYNHPQRRHGNAWGILIWGGRPWHNSEEKPINGAGTKKWFLAGETMKTEYIKPVVPKISLEDLKAKLRAAEDKEAEEEEAAAEEKQEVQTQEETAKEAEKPQKTDKSKKNNVSEM